MNTIQDPGTCEACCPVSSPRGWWRNPLFAPLLAVALIPVLALALRAVGAGGTDARAGAEAGSTEAPQVAAQVVGSRVCEARGDSLLPALLERWAADGLEVMEEPRDPGWLTALRRGSLSPGP